MQYSEDQRNAERAHEIRLGAAQDPKWGSRPVGLGAGSAPITEPEDGGNCPRHAIHLSPIRFEQRSQDCHGDDRGYGVALETASAGGTVDVAATVLYCA
jgi:hypothetical protein